MGACRFHFRFETLIGPSSDFYTRPMPQNRKIASTIKSIAYSRCLQNQLSYYVKRAAEYDEWFLREGRYDRGPSLNSLWFAQVEEVRQALAAFKPTGTVLDVACGTGIWTQQLIRYTDEVVALDASPEMLERCRQRLRGESVRYVEADVFESRSIGSFDVVFFSFWLSHVPPPLFADFWDIVRTNLAPHGRVFFIDSLFTQTSASNDELPSPLQATTTIRQTNDGSQFEIVKVYITPNELRRRLKSLDWTITVKSTTDYFLYGQAQTKP